MLKFLVLYLYIYFHFLDGIREILPKSVICGSTSIIFSIKTGKPTNIYQLNNKRKYYVVKSSLLTKELKVLPAKTLDSWLSNQTYKPELLFDYAIFKPEKNLFGKIKTIEYDQFTVQKYTIQNMLLQTIESQPVPLPLTRSAESISRESGSSAEMAPVPFDPNYKAIPSHRPRVSTMAQEFDNSLKFVLPGKVEKVIEIPLPSKMVITWNIDIAISDLSYIAEFIPMKERYKQSPQVTRIFEKKSILGLTNWEYKTSESSGILKITLKNPALVTPKAVRITTHYQNCPDYITTGAIEACGTGCLANHLIDKIGIVNKNEKQLEGKIFLTNDPVLFKQKQLYKMLQLLTLSARHYKPLEKVMSVEFPNKAFPIKGEIPLLPTVMCKYEIIFSNAPIEKTEYTIPSDFTEWDPSTQEEAPVAIPNLNMEKMPSNSSVLSPHSPPAPAITGENKSLPRPQQHSSPKPQLTKQLSEVVDKEIDSRT